MKTYLLSLLLVSLFAGTLAINVDCYVCNGGLCNDPFIRFGPGIAKSCPTSFLGVNTNFFCKKTVDNSGRVERSCATLCVDGCFGGTCTYCCTSDHCNGGIAVRSSLVAMGVALLAAFLFSRQ